MLFKSAVCLLSALALLHVCAGALLPGRPHRRIARKTHHRTKASKIKRAHTLTEICDTSADGGSKLPCSCDPNKGVIDCTGERLRTADFVTAYERPNHKRIEFKVIKLAGNDIESVTEPLKFLSRYKDSVEELDLSGNQIVHLAPDTFMNFTRLKKLNLSENSLRNGDVFFHSDLQTSLKELYMENNLFTFINATTTRNLDYVHTLSLSRNAHLFKFAGRPFAGMHRLRMLLLDACGIERWLPNVRLDGLDHLEHLSVQNNKITFLPPGAFAAVPALRTLDLAWNHITELQPHAFGHIEHLEELHLNDMQYLWAVEEYAFAGLRRLKVLDLSDCPKLYDFDSLAFGHNVTYAKPIDRIDLQNNNLATWSGSGLFTYKSVGNVKTLKLNGNPWMCDCRIGWMLDVPKDLFSPQQGPSCKLPSNLRGQTILSLDRSQLTCARDAHMGKAALFFLFIFTLATVLAAAWFLYSTNRCRRGASGLRPAPISDGWSPLRFVRGIRLEPLGRRDADGPDFGYKNLVLRAEQPEDAVQMDSVEEDCERRARADSLDAEPEPERDQFEMVSNGVGDNPNYDSGRNVRPAFV